MMMTAQKEVPKLHALTYAQDDASLVAGLRAGHVDAGTVFYNRYVSHVQRIITRVMGVDSELADITSEVFFQSLRSIDTLNDPTRLKAWVTRIAVFTSRKWIRKRKRNNWLRILPAEEIPEAAAREPEPKESSAARAVREIINRMPPDERVVFSLRFLEQMQIAEIADACGYSLRTAKRRLAQCERRFKRMAESDPDIAGWLEASAKWRNR
ncbi:MAG: sigma-70 family RNA polymerase sigma factor [Deltaproteobacteria bacterium]|nr:sigma-70 family RNA polymerase sigma factor [Deltaproteobacteria bacterium]